MDLGLFLIGALGALLTIYLAKQEIIPEFRPFFDAPDDEIRQRQDHIKKTEKDIDDIEAELRDRSLPPNRIEQLSIVLNNSQLEVKAETARVHTLERKQLASQVVSRGMGFLAYTVLGGVFGALLTGIVKVEGLSSGLPTYIQSLLIGATWTTYMSTIGFRTGQGRSDDKIEAVKRKNAEELEGLKKTLTERVAQAMTNAEKPDKVEQPVNADNVALMVAKELDQFNQAMQSRLDVTKQMVRRDARGLL